MPHGQGLPGRTDRKGREPGLRDTVLCRETNMKVRQAIAVTSELGDISKLAKFDGE